MAKRFTATEKWNDPWFCSLSPIYKIFWIYLIDNCDHAGIWQVNWPLVKFHLWNEEPYDLNIFGNRVVVISDEKWFLPKFIEFQYNGTLNPDNRTHASVLAILEKEGVNKGLARGLQGRKDKGTGKVNTKVNMFFEPPTMEEVKEYCLERKNSIDSNKWHDFYSSKGWMIGKNKMKDWKAAVRTWENKEIKNVDTRRFINKKI